MKKEIRILFIEDSFDDVELILLELKRNGFIVTYRVIQNEEDLRSRLLEREWDIILSDHIMPQFSSIRALKLKNDMNIDSPFIIVSGDMPENQVVQAMELGCRDYVMKNNLSRLFMVIQREILDSTNRKENRRMNDQVFADKERLRTTIDSIGDGVIVTDIEGNITMFNEAAEFLTGWSKEEAGGRPIYDILVLVSKETGSILSEPFEKEVNEGQKCGLKRNTALIDKQGNEKIISASNAPIKSANQSMIGSVIVFRDITNIYEAEEDLKRSKEEAEAANKAKSEFLANMSHEIRTPLNGIVGMTDLTLMTKLDESQKENIEIIKICADTLLKVINNILDFSKIEARKIILEKEAFSLNTLLENVLKTHESIAKRKGIKLLQNIHQDISGMLYGDCDKLQQILNNLVGNAIKFTEEGEVGIDVFLVNITKNRVSLRFEISDTGIGILEKDMEKLFKSFSQVDASYTSKYGGSGLGLVISRELIEFLGGSIEVKSEIGKGSVFSFTTPIEIEGADKENEQVIMIESKANKKLEILLVDDVIINLRVTSLLLKQLGHDVTVANNGEEALQIMKYYTFDIVFMDIKMPILDGLTVTKIIRDLEKQTNKHQYIVAYTAFAIKDEIDKFIALGMDDILIKPITKKSLEETLEKYIKSARH